MTARTPMSALPGSVYIPNRRDWRKRKMALNLVNSDPTAEGRSSNQRMGQSCSLDWKKQVGN